MNHLPRGGGRRGSVQDNSIVELDLINLGYGHDYLLERHLEKHVYIFLLLFYFLYIRPAPYRQTGKIQTGWGRGSLILALVRPHLGPAPVFNLIPWILQLLIPEPQDSQMNPALIPGDKSDMGHEMNTDFLETEPYLKQ